MSDHHGGHWRRFSWFGFRRVLTSIDAIGLRRLAGVATYSIGTRADVIADMEALLIKALGCPSNVADMNFPRGLQYIQIGQKDTEDYLQRISPA